MEKGFGVYMTDLNTVNLSEQMKVTVCLNPVQSATGPLGVVLGYDLFAHMLNTNEDMMKMARMVAYDEGLPVVPNPGTLSPQAFVDELFNDRFPNEYLGDTNLRLAVDVSQMVGIRFGETVKAYVEKYGDASRLTAILLGIAGWLRYLMGIDDEGREFTPSSDPLLEEARQYVADYELSFSPKDLSKLDALLANEKIFGVNLHAIGMDTLVKQYFAELSSGVGAVAAALKK